MAYTRQHNTSLAIAARELSLRENNLRRAWYQLLPDLSAYSTLDYNFELPTQLLPAEIFGGPKGALIPVQFGTRYGLSAIAEANVPLVSPVKWKGVKTARLQQEQARMELQSQQVQVMRQVATAYYQLLLADKSSAIAAEQQVLADSLAAIAGRRFNEGIASPVEYQRARQLALEAVITLQEQQSARRQRANDLRQLMHLAPGDSLVVKDTLAAPAQFIAREDFNAGNTAAVKAARLQQEAGRALLQQNRARYLPQLSMYARYGKVAQRNIFDFGAGDGSWFGLGVAGLRLDIPIFQPATQRAAVKESALLYEQRRLNASQVALEESIQWNNWYEQYKECLQSLPAASEAAALARDNYGKTLLQFESGIAAMDAAIERYKDVLQAQWKHQQLQIRLYQLYVLLQSAKADAGGSDSITR